MIFKLIGIVFDAIYVLAYTSLALWIIALIVNIKRSRKNKHRK